MELVQEDSAESESEEVRSQSIKEIKFETLDKQRFNPNISDDGEDEKEQSNF